MDIADHRSVSVIKRSLLVGCCVVLEGCMTFQPVNYRPHYANYSLLQTAPHCTVAVTEHSAVTARIQTLSTRGAGFTSPTGDGFSGFLAASLNEELGKGGIYAPSPQRTLKLSLEQNTLDSSSSTGSADIAVTITVFDAAAQREVKKIPVQIHHEWKSSFFGASAVNFAIAQYSEAVAGLNGKLFADPNFLQAIDCSTLNKQ